MAELNSADILFKVCDVQIEKIAHICIRIAKRMIF
jgi:hypothetical protein